MTTPQSDPCADPIAQNLIKNCSAPAKPGIEQRLLLLDVDDVTSITLDPNNSEVVTEIVHSGLGSFVEGVKQAMFFNNALVVNETSKDGATHALTFNIFNPGKEQRLFLKSLVDGQKVFAVVERKDDSDPESVYLLLGEKHGLRVSEVVDNVNENDGAMIVTVSTEDGKSEPSFPKVVLYPALTSADELGGNVSNLFATRAAFERAFDSSVAVYNLTRRTGGQAEDDAFGLTRQGLSFGGAGITLPQNDFIRVADPGSQLFSAAQIDFPFNAPAFGGNVFDFDQDFTFAAKFRVTPGFDPVDFSLFNIISFGESETAGIGLYFEGDELYITYLYADLDSLSISAVATDYVKAGMDFIWVVGVHSNTDDTVKLYADGVEIASGISGTKTWVDDPIGPISALRQTIIGDDSNGGSIDYAETRWFTRALTAEEVAQLSQI